MSSATDDDDVAVAQCIIYSRVDSTMQRGCFASKSDEYNNHENSNFYGLTERTKSIEQAMIV
jgi:hypothetical protein